MTAASPLFMTVIFNSSPCHLTLTLPPEWAPPAPLRVRHLCLAAAPAAPVLQPTLSAHCRRHQPGRHCRRAAGPPAGPRPADRAGAGPLLLPLHPAPHQSPPHTAGSWVPAGPVNALPAWERLAPPAAARANAAKGAHRASRQGQQSTLAANTAATLQLSQHTDQEAPHSYLLVCSGPPPALPVAQLRLLHLPGLGGGGLRRHLLHFPLPAPAHRAQQQRSALAASLQRLPSSLLLLLGQRASGRGEQISHCQLQHRAVGAEHHLTRLATRRRRPGAWRSCQLRPTTSCLARRLAYRDNSSSRLRGGSRPLLRCDLRAGRPARACCRCGGGWWGRQLPLG